MVHRKMNISLLIPVLLMLLLVTACSDRQRVQELFRPPEPTPDCASPLQRNSSFCTGVEETSPSKEPTQISTTTEAVQEGSIGQPIASGNAPENQEISAVRGDAYAAVLQILHEQGFYQTDDEGTPLTLEESDNILAYISFEGFHPENPQPVIQEQQIDEQTKYVIRARVVNLSLRIPDRSKVTTQYLRVLLKMDDPEYEQSGQYDCPQYRFEEGVRGDVFYAGSMDEYVYECMPSYMFAGLCQSTPEESPHVKGYTGWVRIEIIPNPQSLICTGE